TLQGDSIRFKQTYWQYFLGVRSNIDLGQFAKISNLKLLLQVDWAYVDGLNEDQHLHREGRRLTYDYTNGYGWHGVMALKKGLVRNLTLGLEVEYLSIYTTGSHRLVNSPLGIDISLTNGVKVWSDQASLSLNLEYRF
ncbi:MAG: hypothetical protein L7F78_18295, partial [Syntrophales bacterium LBB04]|nr:hypothetical protein [Syntrophales bacterium LBB04]